MDVMGCSLGGGRCGMGSFMPFGIIDFGGCEWRGMGCGSGVTDWPDEGQ